MTRKLHLDFECYAEVSLKEVGAHVFVAHRSFCVTAVAWAFDNDPVKSEVYPATCTLPWEIERHINSGGTVCAHNAAFERTILVQHYGLIAPVEQFDCTMQRVLVWGLPAGLGAAGRALNLSILKDETEKTLMQNMAKPRKNSQPYHQTDQVRLARLAAYCRQDVEAERALDAAVPALSAFERRVSDLDARSNLKGVRVDVDAVVKLKLEAAFAVGRFNDEAKVLTLGAVSSPGTETDKVIAWLLTQGWVMPNLQKETVAEWIADPALDPSSRRLLELRQLSAKASLKKLDKMLKVAGLDERARGLLQYAGAGRTHRWAGRLIQVQNLPRPDKSIVPEQVIAAAKAGQRHLNFVWPDPLLAISSSLRGCLVASHGHMLLSLDLAQIEVRVLAWLAGETALLDAFRKFDAKQGPDIYVHTAAKIGSGNRALGKELSLACQFGMGGPKFHERVTANGLTMSMQDAEAAVAAWRAANRRIQTFWWDVQAAAIEATQKPGKVLTVRTVKLKVAGGVLMIRKPNGEKLFYHGARIGQGRFGDEFHFDGVSQKTGHWIAQTTYGGKFVENITQSVARDVMADALLRIEEKFKLTPVMTVHDEAVYEIDAGAVDLPAFVQREFEATPSWAPGLPIASDTRCSGIYGK